MAPNSAKPLTDVRIRLHELRFKEVGSTNIESVRMPFGIGINVEHYQFQKITVTKGYEIRALYVGGIRSNNSHTIVYPGYQATDHVTDSETGERAKLRLWTVYTDRDRLAARQVIQRVHYLSDSGRGMFLACAFSDPQQQTRIRRQSRKRNLDSDDISWLIPPGGVIGAGVVDTLWHGNPIAGRTLIAKELKIKGDEWKSWTRDEVVRRLRIVWASRFAIDAPYQDLGIGAVLARHLKVVARRYHAPAADFIEVITTTPRNRPESGKGDFLQKAGYVRLKGHMKSGSLMVMDQSSGYRTATPAVKNYYFADLRNDDK